MKRRAAACRAVGVEVPTRISHHTDAIQAVPARSAYAEYSAQYERRCRAVMGPRETLPERVAAARQLDGEIRVFDCDGRVAEVLPVRWEEKRRRRPERLAA